MGGVAFLVIAAWLFGLPQPAAADDLIARTAVPAPYWAKSIEVVDDGAPVMLEPDAASQRRGTVGAGTRLGFKRRVFGEGCSTGVWYETRDALYICEGHVEPSPQAPGPAVDEHALSGRRLPQRYAFIKFDGTRAYHHPSDYFRNDYVESFGKSFGIVVTGEQVYEGVEFVRTRKLLWVERSSVRFVDGSPFRGEKLGRGDALDFAWVSVRPSKVYDEPGGRVVRRLDRHTVVRVAARKGAWVRLRSGAWIRRAALAIPELVPPPEGVGPTER